jgi:hypothetical protein
VNSLTPEDLEDFDFEVAAAAERAAERYCDARYEDDGR